MIERLSALPTDDIAFAMKNGFNPSRRNRNIGTFKQGHEQNNRFVIPSPGGHFPVFSQIDDFDTVKRNVAGNEVTFLIQKTRSDCFHACTVDDITTLFGAVPAKDWEGLQTLVFRQPTRKQSIASPVWGRLQYYSDIVTPQKRNVASGPVLHLEAVKRGDCYKICSSLSPEFQVGTRPSAV